MDLRCFEIKNKRKIPITFALKQITFTLFNIVAITQMLTTLLLSSFLLMQSCCCWLDCFHFAVRALTLFDRYWWILLIRQTLTIALLNTFAWLRASTPFAPIAPTLLKSNKKREKIWKIRFFSTLKIENNLCIRGVVGRFFNKKF